MFKFTFYQNWYHFIVSENHKINIFTEFFKNQIIYNIQKEKVSLFLILPQQHTSEIQGDNY